MTDLAKLRELLEKATKGPWESNHHGVFSEYGYMVCNVSATTGKYESEHHNRNLIAALRNEAPALLDEVEAMRAALRHAIATLERDGDEWGICSELRQALGETK